MIQQRWVNPTDLNSRGNLFGGKMLAWVDEDASIFVRNNIKNPEVVTASFDQAQFLKPVKLGDLLTFKYSVAHVGRVSITVAVKVHSDKNYNCFSGLITFVAVSVGMLISIEHRLPIEELKKEPIWEHVEKIRKLSKVKGLF